MLDIFELISSKEYRKNLGLPKEVREEYSFLARGEYNTNLLFVHPITGKKMILRINEASQMELYNQIEYEANALKILEKTGRTPRVFYVDNTRRYYEKGILVMEYLNGRKLSYDKDVKTAIEILIDIHRCKLDDRTQLIRPKEGFAFVLDECEKMFSVYEESTYKDLEISKLIRNLLDMGKEIAIEHEELLKSSYKTIINTELNSSNFLINEDEISYLIDWEKPVIASPSQDIGHFLAPTTTFFRSDKIFTLEEIREYIDTYIEMAKPHFDTRNLGKLSRCFVKINCLRGLSWCAMAMVEYRDGTKGIINKETNMKISAYLSTEFISGIEKIFKKL